MEFIPQKNDNPIVDVSSSSYSQGKFNQVLKAVVDKSTKDFDYQVIKKDKPDLNNLTKFNEQLLQNVLRQVQQHISQNILVKQMNFKIVLNRFSFQQNDIKQLNEKAHMPQFMQAIFQMNIKSKILSEINYDLDKFSEEVDLNDIIENSALSELSNI